jgi:hypothetical protein
MKFETILLLFSTVLVSASANRVGDAAVLGGMSALTSGIYTGFKLTGVWRRCRKITEESACYLSSGCVYENGECTAKGFLGLKKYKEDVKEKCAALREMSYCTSTKVCYWKADDQKCQARKLRLWRETRDDDPNLNEAYLEQVYLKQFEQIKDFVSKYQAVVG